MPDSLPISVLIPIYNAERYLRRAVGSILNQTFREFELIAVDDGSKDNSLRILKELQAADTRIRIISRPNTGIVGALNDGLAVCTGKYIMRMDSDDIAMPDRFQKQIDFMESHPDCVVCSGKILIIDPDDLPIRYECTATSDADIRHRMEHGGYYLVHPATCIRREAVQKVGGYQKEFEWVEDLDLWLRIGELGTFANVPDHVLNYRLDDKSVSSTKNGAMRSARRIEAWRQYYERRGLTAPARKEATAAAAPLANPAGARSFWAFMALDSGFYLSAIRIAFKALRAYPTKPQPYVALTLSLMGPFGKYFTVTAIRLRDKQRRRGKPTPQ